MTKTLLLMRHAKSDWKQPGLSDHDRPLNARGRKAAPAMADQLLENGWRVDVILASSAVRVQQTVSLMHDHWSTSAEIWTVPALYLASSTQIMLEVQALHDSWNSVLVVAHNPGLAQLVSQLSGRDTEMPTAAVAIFEFATDNWNHLGRGALPVLREFWKPRDLMQ
jgi:phosphohistidine phosphatase